MSTVTEHPVAGPNDVEIERIALRSTLPPAPKPAAPQAKPANRLPDVARPEPAVKKTEPQAKAAEGPSDLDRAGFPHRAMLPEAVACGLISAGWLMGVMPYLPDMFQTLEIHAAIPGTYGLFVGVKWLFRTMAGGYRLSATEILQVIPGPIPDPPPIELARVASVTVDQTPIEWLLLVGRLRLSFERDTQPEELLGPVSWPKWRAKKIEDAITAAREGGVTATRRAA